MFLPFSSPRFHPQDSPSFKEIDPSSFTIARCPSKGINPSCPPAIHFCLSIAGSDEVSISAFTGVSSNVEEFSSGVLTSSVSFGT